MKIGTWNVNGIRARSSQLVHWIDAEEPDVICLQEIKATPAQIPQPVLDIVGYHAMWHGGGGYSGVALLMRTKRTEAEEGGEATAIQLARALEALAGGGELTSPQLCASDERQARRILRSAPALLGGIRILKLQDLGDAFALRGESLTEEAVVDARARVEIARCRSELDRRFVPVELGVHVLAQTARMLRARDQALAIGRAPRLPELGLVARTDGIEDRERLFAVAVYEQRFREHGI